MRVVSTIQEILDLPSDREVNGLFVRSPLRFNFEALPRAEQIRWEARLNRYQRRCGCNAGAITLIAMTGAGLGYLALTSASFLTLSFLLSVFFVLVIAFVGAFISKLAALVATRIQFRTTCERIGFEIVKQFELDATEV